MVTQWRHATGREMLEIPAGTLDPGESPRATAERELGEECGLAADGWEEGPSFFTAPGFCTERLTLFLATGLRETDASGPDDELLEQSWLSLPDAMAAVDDGRIIDAKSVAGILWLARRLTPPTAPELDPARGLRSASRPMSTSDPTRTRSSRPRRPACAT